MSKKNESSARESLPADDFSQDAGLNCPPIFPESDFSREILPRERAALAELVGKFFKIFADADAAARAERRK